MSHVFFYTINIFILPVSSTGYEVILIHKLQKHNTKNLTHFTPISLYNDHINR